MKTERRDRGRDAEDTENCIGERRRKRDGRKETEG
jgi:hypothetical protein